MAYCNVVNSNNTSKISVAWITFGESEMQLNAVPVSPPHWRAAVSCIQSSKRKENMWFQHIEMDNDFP